MPHLNKIGSTFTPNITLFQSQSAKLRIRTILQLLICLISLTLVKLNNQAVLMLIFAAIWKVLVKEKDRLNSIGERIIRTVLTTVLLIYFPVKFIIFICMLGAILVLIITRQQNPSQILRLVVSDKYPHMIKFCGLLLSIWYSVVLLSAYFAQYNTLDYQSNNFLNHLTLLLVFDILLQVLIGTKFKIK